MLGFAAKAVLVLGGLLLIVLGSHGLYVYLHRADILADAWSDHGYSSEEYGSRLFLSIDTPDRFENLVWWASREGAGGPEIFPLGGSWVVPAVLIAGGILLCSAGSRVS